MPTHHVPKRGELPDVEVLVEGVWCPGELRMWTQGDEGAWTAQVRYQPPAGGARVIGAFSADEVRESPVDRPRGTR